MREGAEKKERRARWKERERDKEGRTGGRREGWRRMRSHRHRAFVLELRVASRIREMLVRESFVRRVQRMKLAIHKNPAPAAVLVGICYSPVTFPAGADTITHTCLAGEKCLY